MMILTAAPYTTDLCAYPYLTFILILEILSTCLRCHLAAAEMDRS
jgi:hypothetical protein